MSLSQKLPCLIPGVHSSAVTVIAKCAATAIAIAAISGSRVVKKRVISEIARSQYCSCTAPPQKNAAIRLHSLVGLGRWRQPTSVSDIGKREQGIENDQVEMRAALALPLLAPCNHRFRRRCRRHGVRSREASGTGRQGFE